MEAHVSGSQTVVPLGEAEGASSSSTPPFVQEDPATCPITPGRETTIEIDKGRLALGVDVIGGINTLLVSKRPLTTLSPLPSLSSFHSHSLPSIMSLIFIFPLFLLLLLALFFYLPLLFLLFLVFVFLPSTSSCSSYSLPLWLLY